MFTFHFNFENKIHLVFITSIVLAINFRTTFKNVDFYMDLGDYPSTKFNPMLIFIKNIFCSFFLLLFYILYQYNLSRAQVQKQIIETKINDIIIMEEKDQILKESFSDLIFRFHHLNNKNDKIKFILKNLSIIALIYFIEEAYFILANEHVMDRLFCAIRNVSIFASLLLFYPIIFHKKFVIYRHQIWPLIINMVLSFILIIYNIGWNNRFFVIFNSQNLICYWTLFFLLGLEMILIKYLIDYQFLDITLILGIKGIIGTIVFSIINICFSKKNFFELIDKLIIFEYDDLYEEFPLYYEIIYVISLIAIQYCKCVLINQLSETHYACSFMIKDIGFFLLYAFERFILQDFGNKMLKEEIPLFFLNLVIGALCLLLILSICEIIDFDFCNLNFNKNVKKNINKRQLSDILASFE